MVTNFIQNKEEKKVKVQKPITLISLKELEEEIATFIDNARNNNYLYSNEIISEKERKTWRFKVKAWFKEITNPKREDNDLELRAELLHNLLMLRKTSKKSDVYRK